jgi:hypothetical protein
MMRQRFYLDGKLQNTTKPREAEVVRRYLDNIERDWLRGGLCPLTPEGEFDTNNAHEVTRVSPDELLITNTRGRKLRFVNVEVK